MPISWVYMHLYILFNYVLYGIIIILEEKKIFFGSIL